MSDVLVQALLYNRWANLQLLDVCSGLSEEQLLLSSSGTYGTIAATWQHLLAAEQRYLMRLVGFQPQITEKDEFPGIEKLKEHAQRSGDQLVVAVGMFDPDGTSPGRQNNAVRHWVVMAQAMHHGNDHRTQICTILGQNGISYGDLDVWAFGLDNGGYTEC